LKTTIFNSYGKSHEQTDEFTFPPAGLPKVEAMASMAGIPGFHGKSWEAAKTPLVSHG
jgi:hypothetical protein